MNKSQNHVGACILLVLAVSTWLVIGTVYDQVCQAKSEPAEKQIVAPITKTPYGSKALGPQPEPPDKPDPSSKGLGPQPEPPDSPDPNSKSLGPQPEPPDRNSKRK